MTEMDKFHAAGGRLLLLPYDEEPPLGWTMLHSWLVSGQPLKRVTAWYKFQPTPYATRTE